MVLGLSMVSFLPRSTRCEGRGLGKGCVLTLCRCVRCTCLCRRDALSVGEAQKRSVDGLCALSRQGFGLPCSDRRARLSSLLA
jgi:hypothetical protein